MRKLGYSFLLTSGIFAAVSFTSVSAYAAAPRAQILDVNHFIGVLDYKTGRNDSLNVEIKQGRKIKANVLGFSKGFMVTSNLGKVNNISCQTRGNKMILKIDGIKYEPEDLPTIVAKGSDKDGLRIRNSHVVANVGNIGGATVDIAGCGDIVIGNIKHSLEVSGGGSGDFTARDIGQNANINISGSGNVKVGKVGENVKIELSGSGDAQLGDVKGRAFIDKSGSGDIKIASVKELNINSSGSGDIEVKGGKGVLNAVVNGSGDIEYKGTAINPNVRINGSGEAKIHSFEGNQNIVKR